MEKKTALEVLSALAQEARLDVFRTLVAAGPEGLAAGAVGEVLEIPAATLSFHLKELRNAGLLHCRRQGRSRIYSADFEAVAAFVAFLTENCCAAGDAGLGCAAVPAIPAVQAVKGAKALG